MLCLIGDYDYVFKSYNVSVPAGTTRISLNISIINDNILEENENFTLSVVPSSHVTIGDPGKATVVILNDDGKLRNDIIIIMYV